MTVLLNMIPLFIGLIGLIISYFVTGAKKKTITFFATIAVIFIYNKFQPSYIPKGVVQKQAHVETVVQDKPIVDRMLKPKSADQYELERKAELDKISDRLNEKVK